MPNTEETKIIVQIQPNAKKNEVTGFADNILRLKIAAPPVEGKANRELIEYLSKLLDISKSRVILDKGATSKKKVIIIRGISANQIEHFFSAYNKPDLQKRLL